MFVSELLLIGAYQLVARAPVPGVNLLFSGVSRIARLQGRGG